MATSVKKTVLVIGGTGALGKRVVREVLKRGHAVRALVRPTSDASQLEAQGVAIARGDMMQPASLGPAFAGVDAVISTANGYMRRRPGDTMDTDLVGNRNLVDAAANAKTPVFVFCSVLKADVTPNVPHFAAKFTIEKYIAEKGIPSVIVRPGAFLDKEYLKSDLEAHRVSSMFNTNVPSTWIHPDEVARSLAAAVDQPAAIGLKIELGSTEPVTMAQLAEIVTKVRGDGQPTSLRTVPRFVLWCVSWFSPLVADLIHMFDYFNTGGYVADTKLQQQYLVAPISTEENVRLLLKECGLIAA